MNGARRLFEVARAAGLDTCFANPGTTELDLVVALDETPGFRTVLGLFEGVCTGAADGKGGILTVEGYQGIVSVASSGTVSYTAIEFA